MVEDVRKAIEKAVLKACEGLRQGNASAVAAIYTEDAAILPPDSEMIRGRQGIEKFWKAAMQMGVKDAVFPILELSGTDEIVHTIGNYIIKIQPKGQKPTEHNGNTSPSGNIRPLAGRCIGTFGTAICRDKNELCQKMKNSLNWTLSKGCFITALIIDWR